MDDISEKLAGLLKDPETMARVKQMAENLLGDSQSEPQGQSGVIGDMPAGDELQAMISIMQRLKSSGDDSRTQLLAALKPHLSEPKREKVDTAIKILKILDLLPIIKDTGLFKL